MVDRSPRQPPPRPSAMNESLSSLERVLDEHGLGRGALTASRIGKGSSNQVWLLERGPDRFVLRRPPAPPYPPSTHDVVREARLQQSLATLDVRVPRILLIHEDESVLGVPFTIAEFVDGEVVTTSLPRALERDLAGRRLAIEDVVRTLAEIHAVDTSSALLAPFVRSGSYLERQVRRFGELWQQTATREIADIPATESWLRENLPNVEETAVVHGDYRLGNIMFSKTSPAQVRVVLDWEMGAIGDPRADVGYFLATYSHRSSYGTALEMSPVTTLDGFPEPAEILDLYARFSGRDPGDVTWFVSLALWKAAVFCEAIHWRYLQGELDHDPFAAQLGTGVPGLAAAAARAASS